MAKSGRFASYAAVWVLPVTLLLLASGLALTAALAQSQSATDAAASSAQDLLRIPDVDYRRDWTLLGTFSLLADDPEAGAKEFHVVYMQPEYVDAYRNTGALPDGAVLIKDVFATQTEALTTGTASYAASLIGRFIMVKDRSDRHAPNSPLWGDGWGWAFYEGAETRKTVTTNYRDDCLGCHEPAREQDLIYLQGYPILKK